jgi:ribosomal protein S4
MMQDLAQRIKVERAIDELLQAKDLEVEGLAKAAQEARKRNDYNEAQRLVTKAREIYRPDRKLLQVLCDAGKAKSFGAARRLVEQNLVHVDGALARRHDITVAADQVVTLKGEQL